MAPFVLAILIATGETHDPASVALLAAVNESVGAAVSVRLVEVVDRSDAEVLRVERELNATAVAAVTWSDPARLGAVVRVHARGNSWSNRTITFTPQDATSEKGRALGLVITAMWLEAVPAAKPPAATPSPPAAPPPATPPPAPAATSEPASPATTVTKAGDGETPPPHTAGPRRFAIGAAGVGAIGVGGPASAVGAALEGLGSVTNRFALRLGASWRTGPLSELPGSHTVGTAGAGCEIWLLGADATFGLGVRVGVLAIVHRVSADRNGGPSETHDRWLPGADLRIEAGIRLGRNAAWVIGAGTEAAAGTTEIRKGANPVVVATIPAVTLVGETGLRLVF